MVQRNSHASVVDGLVLSGGHPAFVAPAYDEAIGIAHTVEPDTLEQTLQQTPEASAVFVVSPPTSGLRPTWPRSPTSRTGMTAR